MSKFARGYRKTSIGFGIVVCIATISLLANLSAQGFFSAPDPELLGLHQLGLDLAHAILEKDSATLLRYDRADLRAEDELALKQKDSDLYCFLFDSRCISPRPSRSVFEKLSRAHDLQISVVRGRKSSGDTHRYAQLLFYDRSQVSEKSLRSAKYLCEQSPNQIVSWSFK